jgi:hypothetical protein
MGEERGTQKDEQTKPEEGARTACDVNVWCFDARRTASIESC